MRDFLRPQAPVSGTCRPVPPPCLPGIEVPVPLRLPKSTRQKKGKNAIFPVPRCRSQAPAHQSCCPVSLVLGSLSLQGLQKTLAKKKKKGENARFSPSSGARLRHPPSGPAALPPSHQGPCPFKASKKHSPKKNRSGFFPPAGSRGEGRSHPAGPGLVSYPLARRWVLAGVDVVWMLSCVLWSLF